MALPHREGMTSDEQEHPSHRTEHHLGREVGAQKLARLPRVGLVDEQQHRGGYRRPEFPEAIDVHDGHTVYYYIYKATNPHPYLAGKEHKQGADDIDVDEEVEIEIAIEVYALDVGQREPLAHHPKQVHGDKEQGVGLDGGKQEGQQSVNDMQCLRFFYHRLQTY